jgi:hypothetical protein
MTALVDFGPVRFERIGMSSVAMFRVVLMTPCCISVLVESTAIVCEIVCVCCRKALASCPRNFYKCGLEIVTLNLACTSQGSRTVH